MRDLRSIRDECSNCGEILQCELCKQGHGLNGDRENVVEMIKCQFEHREKRQKYD